MGRELSMLADGRLLDCSPMDSGKSPVVLNDGVWEVFEGPVADVGNSRPLTKAEIAALPTWVVEAEGKAPEKELEQKPKMTAEEIYKRMKENPRVRLMNGNPDAPKSFVVGM